MLIDELSETPVQDLEPKVLKSFSTTTPTPLSNIGFANEEPGDPEVQKRIANITLTLLADGGSVSPFIIKYFENPRLFNSLPPEIRNNSQLLGDYMVIIY